MRHHLIVLGWPLLIALFAFRPASSWAGENDQFKPIFDGKTLNGWEGDLRFWSVRDGAITGQTTKENPAEHNTFLIWRGGRVADFQLRLKFRIVGHNSGIQFRSEDQGDFTVAGYQADLDAAGKWIGTLYDEKTGRGVLARRGTKVLIDKDGNKHVLGQTTPEKVILFTIRKEDWNEYDILAVGTHIVQKINGLVTVDVTDHQTSKAKRSGILALQLHRGPPMLVQFKDIQLKRIK